MRRTQTSDADSYIPSETLVGYLDNRLQIEKERRASLSAGEEESPEMEKKLINSKRRKVYVLNNIIFPSMANIVIFFEYISKNPELQVLFEDNIKQLLWGTYSKKVQGPVFRRLIEAIIKWSPEEHKSKKKNNMNLGNELNFRMHFYHIMLQSISLTLPARLKDQFEQMESVVNTTLITDLQRIVAWTYFLSRSADDFDSMTSTRPILF